MCLLDYFRERTVLDENGCWLWQLGLDKDGYGRATISQRKGGSHRFAYEAAKGPIPAGMEIDHLCRVKACCNPDHLEAVTYRENQRRGSTFLALNPLKTHCPQGHPLTDDNLYRDRRGWRGCRTCRAAAQRRLYHKRRA